MRPATVLASLLAAAMVVSLPTAQAAKIKCWTNSDGVRECGNSIPPEYAQQETIEKTSSGVTTKRTKAAQDRETARKERLAKIEARKKQRAEAKRKQRQIALDRVLLDTYATEDDMHLAHTQNIESIDSRINHSKDHIGKLEQTLAAMHKVAANEQRAGKEVDAKQLADINSVQSQIEAAEGDIARREREKGKLQAKYEKDLSRFRFLYGGGALGAPVEQ